MRVSVMACAMSWVCSTWSADARAQADNPDAATDAGRGAAAQDADDAAITARVARLLAAAAPDAAHVEVSTRNGIVTLAGRVDSEVMRDRVVALALATAGVISVNDQLILVPPPARPAGD